MLSNLESIIGEGLKSFSIFAPILALLGGILTSISPCSLASIPLIIGFMTGTKEDDTKRAFKTSVVFAIGMAITYTTLGVLAALLSKIFNQSGPFWNIFLGIVMILMALQTWEVINVVPSKILTNKSKKTGYVGALLWGVLLFLLYSIGNSILVVVAGTSAGFVGKVMSNKSYGKISDIVKIIFGIIILLIGIYFLYLGF